MYCSKCGNIIPEGSRFCNWCGCPADAGEVSQPAGQRVSGNGRNTEARPKAESAADSLRAAAPSEGRRAAESKKGGIPKGVVILFICLAAAALLVAAVFLIRYLQKSNTADAGTKTASEEAALKPASVDARLALWQSGNLDDLAGRTVPEPSESDKVYAELKEEYAEFFTESPETESEEPSVIALLMRYTKLSVETPESKDYPMEATLNVTGPDAAAVLRALNFETYEDPVLLYEALAAALEEGNYETREVSVPVVFNEKDGIVYAEENEAAVRALYGGLIELDEEQMLALYDALYQEVNQE